MKQLTIELFTRNISDTVGNYEEDCSNYSEHNQSYDEMVAVLNNNITINISKGYNDGLSVEAMNGIVNRLTIKHRMQVKANKVHNYLRKKYGANYNIND